MHDQVALVQQLHRHTSKAAVADRAPRVALIDEEPEEASKLGLVVAKRRRPTVVGRRSEIAEEVLQILGRPLPRPALRAVTNATNQRNPGRDRRRPQHPAALLASPTLEHRLENRIRQAQRPHTITKEAIEQRVEPSAAVLTDTPASLELPLHQTRWCSL
jgi:hypothetical protein